MKVEGFLVSSKKLILPAGKCSRRRAKIRKNEQYNASCFDSNHQNLRTNWIKTVEKLLGDLSLTDTIDETSKFKEKNRKAMEKRQ